MPLIRIQRYPGNRQVFIAAEEISHLATVEVSMLGAQHVRLGSDTSPERAAGVAWGARSGAISGKVIRVVTNAIVSGVICAVAVKCGDRLTLASGGRVTPLNTIVTSGQALVSGLVASGAGGMLSGNWSFSGFVVSGCAYVSGSFITGRDLGKALASGAALAGIPMMVTVGA